MMKEFKMDAKNWNASCWVCVANFCRVFLIEKITNFSLDEFWQLCKVENEQKIQGWRKKLKCVKLSLHKCIFSYFHIVFLLFFVYLCTCFIVMFWKREETCHFFYRWRLATGLAFSCSLICKNIFFDCENACAA